MTTTSSATLGSRIRTYRERLELSPADLARQTGLGEAHVLSIEKDVSTLRSAR